MEQTTNETKPAGAASAVERRVRARNKWYDSLQNNWRDIGPDEIWDAAWEAAVVACAECVPTNWLDSMLTGPTAVIRGENDIEAVLREVRARITERSNASFSGGPSGPSAASDSCTSGGDK